MEGNSPMTNPRHLWLASAVALAVAVPAFAQDTVRQRTTVRSGSTSTSTTEVVKLSKVMKSKVLIQKDEPAGQIVDIVISDDGCVNYYVASYEDEYYVIPYSAITWRDSVVFVDITPAQFKKIEFFSSNNWPDLTSTTFQKTVFSTFGVTSFRGEGRRSTFKPDASDRRDDREDAREDRRGDAKDRAKDRRDDAKDQAKDRKDADDRRDDAKGDARDRRDDRDAKPGDKDAPRDRAPAKPDAKDKDAKDKAPDAKGKDDKEQPKPRPGVIDPPKKPTTPEKSPGTVPKRDDSDKPADKKPSLPNPPKPSDKEPKKP
jgi:hypothetical protein